MVRTADLAGIGREEIEEIQPAIDAALAEGINIPERRPTPSDTIGGMMGAATATVPGQILTAALAVWYLCHMKAVRLKPESFRFHSRLAKNTCPWAFAAFCPRFPWSWRWRPFRT